MAALSPLTCFGYRLLDFTLDLTYFLLAVVICLLSVFIVCYTSNSVTINTKLSSIQLQVTVWCLQFTSYIWQFVLSVSIDTLPFGIDKLIGFYLSNYLRKLHVTNDQWQFNVFGLGVADCLNDLFLVLDYLFWCCLCRGSCSFFFWIIFSKDNGTTYLL